MKLLHWAVGGLLGAILCANLRAADLPQTIMDDPVLLAKTKQELAAGNGPRQAIANLKHDADRLLDLKPASVMNKAKPGPSGDKHDYVSYAPYFWPDPNNPSAPYIRKDGHRNADLVANGDAPAYERTLSAIHTLGLAYYYTGDDRYAQQAAKLARTWFLAPATAMNPNFKFAQAVPNSVSGRGTGLIEDRGLVGCLDGLTLIAGTKYWTPDDDRQMHAWVEKFDVWITTSDEGLAEKAAKNNHGSWYAVQETGLYLYLGKTEKARDVLLAIKERISKQIQPDGRQPLEIARQDGYSYSVFNAQALVTLAQLAQRQKIDLWNYSNTSCPLRAASKNGATISSSASPPHRWFRSSSPLTRPRTTIRTVPGSIWKRTPSSPAIPSWPARNNRIGVYAWAVAGKLAIARSATLCNSPRVAPEAACTAIP